MMSSGFEGLVSRRLTLVTGKGGTGKTLFSLALARHAAAAGMKVMLIENHYQGKLASLDPGLPGAAPGSGLVYRNLDFASTFQDFVDKEFARSAVAKKIFQADFLRNFLAAIPGFYELLFLGELVQLAKSGRYDVVICDSFASGHFLSLLRTPEAIIKSGIGGRVSEEAGKIKRHIEDEAFTRVAVMVPLLPLVALETVEFTRKFMEFLAPTQVAWVQRRPLSDVCGKEHHPPATAAYLEGVRMQAKIALGHLDGFDRSGISRLWVNELGGFKTEDARRLHELMLGTGA